MDQKIESLLVLLRNGSEIMDNLLRDVRDCKAMERALSWNASIKYFLDQFHSTPQTEHALEVNILKERLISCRIQLMDITESFWKVTSDCDTECTVPVNDIQHTAGRLENINYFLSNLSNYLDNTTNGSTNPSFEE